MSMNLMHQPEDLMLIPIFNKMNDGLIILDNDRRIIFFNQVAEEIYGLRSAQVMGRRIAILEPDLGMDKLFDHPSEHLRTLETIGGRNYVVSTGTIREDGCVYAAYAIIQDTGSLPYQELNALLSSPYEGIVIFNPDLSISFANSVALAFFRCHTQGELSRRIAPLVERSLLKTAFATARPMSGELLTDMGARLQLNYLPIKTDDSVRSVIVKSSIRNSFEKSIVDYLESDNVGTARYVLNDIAGDSPALMEQKKLLTKAARTTSTVLITGESGTGKEIFAHALHNLSPRRNGPFIKVNCAAVPEPLLESELFGYSEGAFTGARRGGKPGKFELADQGTIFLDEIGDMSLAMQAKLLRVLQEREIERVGATKATRVDVRVVTATNHDLSRLVEQKKFRQDLYYRLNVVVINLPPLRERINDIPTLTATLLERLNSSLGTSVTGVSPEVLEAFSTYAWPGNIRELENLLERAMNFADSNMLTLEHFPDFIRSHPSATLDRGRGLGLMLEQQERDIILQTLDECKGNKSLAARKMQIHRSALYRKLEKYGIVVNERSTGC